MIFGDQISMRSVARFGEASCCQMRADARALGGHLRKWEAGVHQDLVESSGTLKLTTGEAPAANVGTSSQLGTYRTPSRPRT